MSIEELETKYAEMCESHYDCESCKYYPMDCDCRMSFCYEQGRVDAINEFVKALEEHQQKNWTDNLEYGITFADIEEVAAQLKEKNNE